MRTKIFIMINFCRKHPVRGNCVLHRRSGFTLIELVAVAALIALLFSIGIASYAKTFHRWAIEQNARQLYLTARSGRLYAVEHQQPCRLVLDSQNKQFFLMAGDGSDEADSEGMTIISTPWSRRVQLHDHVSYESVKIVGRTDEAEGGILFRPDGTSDYAMIQLGDGKIHYTIAVSGGTGRARLLEGEAEQIQPDQIDLDMTDTM